MTHFCNKAIEVVTKEQLRFGDVLWCGDEGMMLIINIVPRSSHWFKLNVIHRMKLRQVDCTNDGLIFRLKSI